MKLVILLLIASLFSYQVRAGEDRIDLCARQPDLNSCNAKACHWHFGYCYPACDCTELSPDECCENPNCTFNEIDNGNCVNIPLNCEYYDHDTCLASSSECAWNPDLRCYPNPQFFIDCPNLSSSECQAYPDFCLYQSDCVNNEFPSEVWDLCKEACCENPYGRWETFQAAYCIDNVNICDQYSIEECKCHSDICAVERIYNCDVSSGLNQCSNPNGYHFTEKCRALLYGCEKKTEDECKCDPLCTLVDEVGQCYPECGLNNCNGLSDEECLLNDNCCFKYTCQHLTGAGGDCLTYSSTECSSHPECTLIDIGYCSDIPFECSNFDCEDNCNYYPNRCNWIPNVTSYCSNNTPCYGFNYEECKENCEVCDWQRETCKHHP